MDKSLWFVGYTNPASETRARGFLERAKAEVYLPMIEVQTMHSRQLTLKVRPLFPRYLFLRGITAYDAQNCPGIAHLVRRGSDQVRVTDRVVDAIRTLEATDGLVDLPPAPATEDKALRIGQRVVIGEGPFAGKIGLYQGMSENSRVAVLVSILRRALVVDLPNSGVKAE